MTEEEVNKVEEEIVKEEKADFQTIEGAYVSRKFKSKGVYKSGKNKGKEWKYYEVFILIEEKEWKFWAFNNVKGFDKLTDENEGVELKVVYLIEPFERDGETYQVKKAVGFHSVDGKEKKQKVSSELEESTPHTTSSQTIPQADIDILVKTYLSGIESDKRSMTHFMGTILIIMAKRNNPELSKQLETVWADKIAEKRG